MTETFADRYELIRELGKGSMGMVYLCRDRVENRLAALKEIGRENRELIRREFEILRSVTHRGIAKATDYIEDPSSRAAFLVQEYIDGPDLFEASREADPISIARWGMQSAVALHFLHNRGITHGDIKPGNILIQSSENRSAKLVDFGLASRPASRETASGTPAYMAPEILFGASNTPQSDVYSLGATLFHCLSGQTIFSGSDIDSMMKAVAAGKIISLVDTKAGVPPRLAEIIDLMIHPDPAQRYQSAGRAARDLAAFLGETIAAEDWRGGRWSFINRKTELAALTERVELLSMGNTPGAALVYGPKGIGSSRLLEAALDAARSSGIRVISLSSSSQKNSIAVINALLPGKFELDSSSDKQVDEKLLDVEKSQFRSRKAAAEALTEAAKLTPILLAFDDLEDADASSIELFRFLCFDFCRRPGAHYGIGVIGAFSGRLPEQIEADISAGWTLGISISPFSKEEIAQAIEESWGAPPSDNAVAGLAELSTGNPLWLREILNTVTGEDRIAEARAPQSISELIRFSIGKLNPDRIRLLETVCIFGEAAWPFEIAEIADMEQSNVTENLWELVRYGMLKYESGMFAPASKLLAEQVKQDVANGVLRRAHSRSTGILIRRKIRSPASIARHYVDSGELVAAAPYASSAGKELNSSGRHSEAALLLESILAEKHLPAEVRKPILEDMAKYAAPAGLWRKALWALRERIDIAADDLPAKRAEFHLDMAHCQQRIGEYERADRAIERALSEVAFDSKGVQALRAREISALLDIARGRYDKAASTCDDVIGFLDANDPAAGPFKAAKGIALIYIGKPRESCVEFESAVEIFKRENNDAGLIMALSGMGIAHQHLEENTKAVAVYTQALEASRRTGDIRAEATVTMNIATVYHATGAWNEAKKNYNRALVSARQVGASADELRILGNLGNMLTYLGDYENALPLIERSLKEAQRIGLKIYAAYAHLLRGDVLRSRGEMMSARKEFLLARRRFDKLGNAREVAQVDLRIARLYIDMRELSRARDTISIANKQAIDLGNQAFQSEAKSLEARWNLIQGRAREAEIKARDAIELIGADDKGIVWEIRAILGAALLDQRKYIEASEELNRSYKLAVGLRDSLPVEYRDSFLSGQVWNELSRNIDASQKVGSGASDERWKKLVEINRRLTVEHSLDRLLELIMDSVLEIIEAERGFLILIDNGKITVPVARNIDRESIRSAKMKISRSIAEEVAKTGTPLITIDAQQDSRFDRFASVHALKLRSVLCIPLKIREKTIGTLYVDNRFREGAFQDDDLKVMEAFANQAAIAIDNARREEELESNHRKIKSMADELENRVDKQNVQIEEMKVELERLAPSRYVGKYPGIVGNSAGMQSVFAIMERVSGIDVTVLIEGESGTGKELVARAIHFHGHRRDKQFLSENCSAIPETLLESELFGYEKGAFTGAVDKKIGLFEMADGGTLFLDEIGDMSQGMQAKLLRVLQEGEVRRVGGQKTFNVDVRVISATHHELDELVKREKFREDLYYRLNVVKISIPPLRERIDDILLLIKHFCDKYSMELGKKVEVDAQAMRMLMAYEWPGNVRELENEIRKAAVLGEGTIHLEDLSARIPISLEKEKAHHANQFSGKLRKALEEFEKNYMLQVIEECGGNRTEAAKKLGIARRTLYEKIERYNIDNKSD